MALTDEVQARLAPIVARCAADGHVPAAVAAVYRDGAPIFVSATNGASAEVQSRIGSISKTFTAALIMQLRDAGALDLDAPIADHLGPIGAGALTVRNLLLHVSGLQREPEGPWWERNTGGSVEDLLAAVAPEAVVHRPRTRFHYSNLGFGLLGALIERAGGKPWAQALDERILVPLGLTRTTYAPEEPFLRGYVRHPFTGALHEEPRPDAGAMAPAGQLWSTVDDLGRWAAFLADPDPAVLAPQTVAEMCVPQVIADPDEWTSGRGLGVEMWRRGARVFVGHTGSMPGYLAAWLVHRPSRTGVAAFVNAYSMHTGSIAGFGLDLLDAALDMLPEAAPSAWRPPAAVPDDVRGLLGTWWWMGIRHEVRWEGELVVRQPDRPAVTPWRFAPAGSGTWRCFTGMNDGETLRVLRAADGSPEGLDIATFVLTRDPDTLG